MQGGWFVNADQALKLLGLLAGAIPTIAEILRAAASHFAANGEEFKAKRIEEILAEKNEAREVQEQLEGKASP